MPPPYFIGTPGPKQGAHHESIRALWELKWRKRALLGLWPFTEGRLEDFEEAFAHFTKEDVPSPYNFENYSKPFFPVAEKLERLAQEAETAGDTQKASQLFLRAASVYRVARQPYVQLPGQKFAWERNKDAFMKGAKYLDPPIVEHLIPFRHAKPGTIEVDKTIPVTVRMPSHNTPTRFPMVLEICGLDEYRTEHINISNIRIAHGWATICIEIPGTGDCPADPDDPVSPERLWDSVLDWIEKQDWIEQGKVAAWGVSCGAYYAARIAHTHKDRLAGSIAQGGGCHHMFDPDWLDIAHEMEYPFDLTDMLSLKFGYRTVEEMKKDARQRFSLLENGILDQPCCRLLLINGMLDQLFPAEDNLLQVHHGSPKEIRLYQGLKHMGVPAANEAILEWLTQLFQSIPHQPAEPPKSSADEVASI